MNVLSEIIARKRERLSAAKEEIPIEQLHRLAHEARGRAKSHALINVLGADGINIIAEFKRRSPSKGPIRADANLVEVVQSYQAGGAVAISVLTEEDYFAGSLDDLQRVKAAVDLPVLRKDFIFDEYQVYESAAAGADAMLLIVAALDDDALVSLRRLAEDELGLDALIEVHTNDKMKRAVRCGAKLIGVNNRDLRTFEVSLEISLSLAREAPVDVLLISESGLHRPDDLQRLRAAGFRGFVIEEPKSLKRIADESGVQALQLHGDESPEYCRNLATDRYIIKTLAVSQNFDTQTVHAYKTAAIMLDTRDNNLRGGTGRVFDWSIAHQVSQLVPNLFLAGGLSPENIAGAIEAVHPYAVDACSALEDSPGKKNHKRIRSFIETARMGIL